MTNKGAHHDALDSSRTRPAFACLTALIIAQGASTFGQNPPAVPSFPAATDLVTVDVVALDRSGRVVRGLTKDDFVVMEGKRRQTISVFEAWEMPDGAAKPDSAVATAAVEQGVGDRSRRSFAIVVDDITLDQVPNATNLRTALTSWVIEQLNTRDDLTLATSSGKVFWSGRDHEGLLLAIEKIRGLRPPRGLGGAPLPWTGVEHRRAVYRVVEQASLALSGWRGRKAIVLLSQELREEPEEGDDSLQAAIDASRRANTAVYSVDPRSLTGSSDYRAYLPAEPPEGFVAPSGIKEVYDTVAGARSLAEETGGFATTPSNDMRVGLNRVEDEARANYLLGYQSDRALDGKWRTITVKVLKRGLTVRARRGYFATPHKDRAVLVREPGMTVMETPGLSRDFECRASISAFELQAVEWQGTFLLEVPADAFGKKSPPRLTFVAFIKNSRGQPVVRLSHEPTPGRPLVQTLTGDVHFRKSVRLAPGDYALETLVLDESSGRRCRDRVAFKVP